MGVLQINGFDCVPQTHKEMSQLNFHKVLLNNCITTGRRRRFIIFFALLGFCAALFTAKVSSVSAQDLTSIHGTDTSRFFPRPEDFGIPGWQINFQNLNQESRNFLSSSNKGYSFIIDLETSPRTAYTFSVTITLVRPGMGVDPKRGVQVPISEMYYHQFYESASIMHFMPAERSHYGDQSFEAAKDYDKYKILIRRGDYLIDIAGTDLLPDRMDKPPVRDVAHLIAAFIDSRIFGARIGLFRPVQVLNDPSVPFVAGKKMVVYAAVEVEQGREIPKGYMMVINVGMRGFRQLAYQLPLSVKGKTVFGEAGPATDGALWTEEYGEPVEITPQRRAFFNIPHSPGYDTYLYRFYLDPVQPDFYSNYIFKVHLAAPSGTKLWDHIFEVPVKPSGTLITAIIPLPVGYWAYPKDWTVDKWSWITKMEDQAWKRQSYINLMAELPEEAREKFTPKPIADYLRKHLVTSKGQRVYNEKAKEAGEFLMGAFPIAEESFEIHIYEDIPEDIAVDPHTNDMTVITAALELWLKKHPRFDRVIGVVPGSNPIKGGVAFHMDRDTGMQFCYGKKAAVVSVDAPAFQFAHDLAHTFGAVDEFLEADQVRRVSGVKQINTPIARPQGHHVIQGYWAAKQQFMGTPLKPIGSIMGLQEPAWITPEVYKGILEQLSR